MSRKASQNWNCPICGHSVSKVYSFCTNCGAKRSDKGWVCDHCGKNIPYDDYQYCIHCGTKRSIVKKVKPVPPVKRKSKPKRRVKFVEPTSVTFCPSGYTIIGKIGVGGFSDVYKAKDSSGRVVALKVPRIEAADETMSESCFKRFLKEAKVWSKLKHLGIVKVYEYGSKPLPWISIEFMEGGSLRERLKKERLSIKESLEIAIKIAGAIQFAHHNGVVHQDIKPKNILFTSDGIPKLTDWGLVKVLLETSSTTEVFEGTIFCAAPEQLDPERFGKVDWRTDIYTFGVVLYWMLAGKPPYRAKDIFGYIKKIIEKKVKPLHEIDPSVPPKLDAILEKALAKKKEDRYEAIALVERDLRNLLSALRRNPRLKGQVEEQATHASAKKQ